MSTHGLKSAYTDRFENPTMRCRCGYICGGKVWADVGAKMDAHLASLPAGDQVAEVTEEMSLVGCDSAEEMCSVR